MAFETKTCIIEVQPRDKPETIQILITEQINFEFFADKDRQILRSAKFNIFYQIIYPDCLNKQSRQHYFEGTYNSTFNSISILSGALFLDPDEIRGMQIGTYLMNRVVQWVKQWPNAELQTIELLERADVKSRNSRNHFYEQFGIQFNYADSEHSAGESKTILGKDLAPVVPDETWKKNIQEQSLPNYLKASLRENNQIKAELSRKKNWIQGLKSTIDQHKQNPIKWALKVTFYRWRDTIIIAAVIFIILIILLKRF